MATTTTKRRITTTSLTCGCKDSRSVSVPVSISDSSDKSDKSAPKPPRPDLSSAEVLTSNLTSAASSSSDDRFDEASSTPSFSGLLRELTELERSVLAWGPPPPPPPPPAADRWRRHRRARSEGVVFRVAEESVAVVKESADPLGDFRRSMLQMIVEKEIVGGEELRELLRRFLSLNSPRHHELILRAFAEIWAEVFQGYEATPDLLRRSHSLRPISLRKS